MNKLSVSAVDFGGKRTFVRVDFNVPLDSRQSITDDSRIVAALPTIKKLIKDGARVILCSHLGRPKGKVIPELSLAPVAKRLSDLIGQTVNFASDCIGQETDKMAESLQDKDILLLENVRFHIEETKNDPEFARQLASLADLYVNDAFGSAHRAHASTEGITRYFKTNVAGLLMEKELQYLDKALSNPKRPFVAILGGAKISDKINVIENLIGKVNTILIGGGMSFTFFKALGKNIGNSLLEEDKLALAGGILDKVRTANVKFLLPVDCVIASDIAPEIDSSNVSVDSIPDGMKGLDIGPQTIDLYKTSLKGAGTVLWNGPMGVFEVEKFARGTYEIARALSAITSSGAVTIVGGGDSAAAVRKCGLSDKLTHISTGGGATLEFLEGKTLPGVAALTDA
jgi:phosphoglycerate kinase